MRKQALCCCGSSELCTSGRALPAAKRIPSRIKRIRPLVCAQQTNSALSSLKKEVLTQVSGTERGKKATAPQQRAVISSIEALEATNPTVNPAKSPLISGTWALLHQGPAVVEGGESVDATLEGPFLARFQPFTRGIIRNKNNLQIIDLPGGKVENLASFTILNKWEGSINIKGSVEPAAPPEDSVKVNVEFQEFELKLGSWATTISLSSIKPRGWVLTTYLDEDTRVGRGDKGSVFVTRRVAPAAKA